MTEKQLRQRQNGRTTPSISGSSIPKAPLSKDDASLSAVEQDPQYGRMAFHLGSAAFMIYGFQSLSDIAAGKIMAPQVLLAKPVDGPIGTRRDSARSAPGADEQASSSTSPLTVYVFHQHGLMNSLFATIICLIFCAAQDSFPHRPVFVPIRRTLLLFALPIEFVISSIYWSIVFTRPELMFPAAPTESSTPEPSSSDKTLLFRIPLWMDISMHLLPAVALTVHFFLLEKRYNPPASTAGATTLAVSFGAAYSVWVEHCAKQNGRYPYPFLNVMSADERMAMYIGSTVLALLAFWGLNALHK